MNSFEETDVLVGAAIIAKHRLVVGGCGRVNEHFADLRDMVILDWYIGDGEHAQADDVVCKLVGPEHALKSAEGRLLRLLDRLSAPDTAADAALFSIRYKID